jgi:hypothetical protein
MNGNNKFWVGGYLCAELSKENLLDKKFVKDIVGKQLQSEWGMIYCNIEYVVENITIIPTA